MENKTIEGTAQERRLYELIWKRTAACQMADETIDELKSAGLSGQQLYELAQDCGTDSAKLSELALIFQGNQPSILRESFRVRA